MKKIQIRNIRNIESLDFDIPDPGLHVLTGKNGSGKTTLFTCLSRICNNNAYRLGFPSSENSQFDIFSGSITYVNDNGSLKYTKRANGKWRPDKRNANVLDGFHYPQVMNITTKNERVYSQEAIAPRGIMHPDVWMNEKLNTIFGTDKFSNMVNFQTGDLRRGRAVTNNRRRNIAYAIPVGNNNFYTEQNFSFGEIVAINLLHDLKYTQRNSLVLIDELELALHPSAQIGIIDILKEIARSNNLTIIISTHSSTIIRAAKNVIFLDKSMRTSAVSVIYSCPPAKAIGAIGMRDDTNPDVIMLVEDSMAKNLLTALVNRYFQISGQTNYLDIRYVSIGGYKNVLSFFKETRNYIFYDNVYVAAFMDKDVETDVLPYPQFADQQSIDIYRQNEHYLHFLPYTPEVLLVKIMIQEKEELLTSLKAQYNNQLLDYTITETFSFEEYEAPLPTFTTQDNYETTMALRGQFRKKCKIQAKAVCASLGEQLNCSADEIYRYIYKFSANTIDPRGLLAVTLKRIRPRIPAQI